MPIYEYRCTSCGRRQEARVSIEGAPRTRPCEECACPAARIISPCGFRMLPAGVSSRTKRRLDSTAGG